ncbi:16642_t:CDS:2 [Funneliformis geosporum]|uniref:1212_t:CDS:1 n=1 Tax=Funneliformis geosporum TaxID=1117311 RepID=A0A9W4SIY7_9GLOM|nr:16642_t:CDS:2 [Funneliformis geosporum]CAI2171253.1 1212_t:CDS:2 [Funneliformis geosporum]
MEEFGYQPDMITYNLLMFACSKNGDLQMARNLLISMIRSSKTYPSLTPDEYTFTNLFWTYSTYKEPMNYISRDQREEILRNKQLEAEAEAKHLLSGVENKDNSLKLSQGQQIDQRGLLDENEIADMKTHLLSGFENKDVALEFSQVQQIDQKCPLDENKILDLKTHQGLQSELEISNGSQQEKAISENKDLLIIGSGTYPLLRNVPVTYAQTVTEAEMIFNYIITSQTTEMTTSFSTTLSPKLITSYLGVLIKKARYPSVFDFYQNLIPKFNVKLNGWIFLSILDVCYKHKRVDEAWSIWKDWENWREQQNEKVYENEYVRKKAFKEIGMTSEMEYKTYRSMIKILARCNEMQSSIRLLQNLSNLQRPDIKDFILLLQKCVENDDEMAQKKVIDLCYNDPERNKVLKSRNLLAKKWKGQGIKLPPKNKFEESEGRMGRFNKRGMEAENGRTIGMVKNGIGMIVNK